MNVRRRSTAWFVETVTVSLPPSFPLLFPLNARGFGRAVIVRGFLVTQLRVGRAAPTGRGCWGIAMFNALEVRCGV